MASINSARAHWARGVLESGPLPSAPLGKDALKFPGGRASMALHGALGRGDERKEFVLDRAVLLSRDT